MGVAELRNQLKLRGLTVHGRKSELRSRLKAAMKTQKRKDSKVSLIKEKALLVFTFQKRLLAWDSYRCHTSQETTNEIKQYNRIIAVVPGGCTNTFKHQM